jgi:hypothetical protein
MSETLTFEELIHTTVDIGSMDDFHEWLNIAFDAAKHLQLSLHNRRVAGKPDIELEDFVSGKIMAIKDTKYNFERALKFDMKPPEIPFVLTGEAAKEFIEKAENPKKIEVTEQQVEMYKQFNDTITITNEEMPPVKEPVDEAQEELKILRRIKEIAMNRLTLVTCVDCGEINEKGYVCTNCGIVCEGCGHIYEKGDSCSNHTCELSKKLKGDNDESE